MMMLLQYQSDTSSATTSWQQHRRHNQDDSHQHHQNKNEMGAVVKKNARKTKQKRQAKTRCDGTISQKLDYENGAYTHSSTTVESTRVVS
mmetsp:Transcript_18293/g.18477  ORF Transcript_18293/g.18477 Transcript_18293/m.18477 type:complete len:90 (-) Transcript_18293:213-482(-)